MSPRIISSFYPPVPPLLIDLEFPLLDDMEQEGDDVCEGKKKYMKAEGK